MISSPLPAPRSISRPLSQSSLSGRAASPQFFSDDSGIPNLLPFLNTYSNQISRHSRLATADVKLAAFDQTTNSSITTTRKHRLTRTETTSSRHDGLPTSLAHRPRRSATKLTAIQTLEQRDPPRSRRSRVKSPVAKERRFENADGVTRRDGRNPGGHSEQFRFEFDSPEAFESDQIVESYVCPPYPSIPLMGSAYSIY